MLLAVWPYYVEQFPTDLDRLEVASRLRTLIIPHSFWIPPNYGELKGRFIGRVDDGSFSMTRVMHYAAGHFPFVRGRIESVARGTIVRVTYLAPGGYAFLIATLALAAVAFFSSARSPVLVVICILLLLHYGAGTVFCKELALTDATLRELLRAQSGEAKQNPF
jgi:hypothetical protein